VRAHFAGLAGFQTSLEVALVEIVLRGLSRLSLAAASANCVERGHFRVYPPALSVLIVAAGNLQTQTEQQSVACVPLASFSPLQAQKIAKNALLGSSILRKINSNVSSVPEGVSEIKLDLVAFAPPAKAANTSQLLVSRNVLIVCKGGLAPQRVHQLAQDAVPADTQTLRAQ
jgi:hypothetical protein